MKLQFAFFATLLAAIWANPINQEDVENAEELNQYLQEYDGEDLAEFHQRQINSDKASEFEEIRFNLHH